METRRLLAYFVDLFLTNVACGIIWVTCFVLEIDHWFISGVSLGFILCKDCFGGQSIGKRMFNYQIVDRLNGDIANPWKCIVRNLFYFLGIIDIAMMLYQSRGMRLGDYVAHTQVVVKKKNWEIQWVRSIIAIACVFLTLFLISLLLHKYVTSLGLLGLLYM